MRIRKIRLDFIGPGRQQQAALTHQCAFQRAVAVFLIVGPGIGRNRRRTSLPDSAWRDFPFQDLDTLAQLLDLGLLVGQPSLQFFHALPEHG